MKVSDDRGDCLEMPIEAVMEVMADTIAVGKSMEAVMEAMVMVVVVVVVMLLLLLLLFLLLLLLLCKLLLLLLLFVVVC